MERVLFSSDKWLKMLDHTIIRTDVAALPATPHRRDVPSAEWRGPNGRQRSPQAGWAAF